MLGAFTVSEVNLKVIQVGDYKVRVLENEQDLDRRLRYYLRAHTGRITKSQTDGYNVEVTADDGDGTKVILQPNEPRSFPCTMTEFWPHTKKVYVDFEYRNKKRCGCCGTQIELWKEPEDA